MSDVSMIDGHIDETKLKDEDIIKALECCVDNECTECCFDEQTACIEYLLHGALDLIRRKDEIIKGLIAGQETLQKHLADKQKQIEKLEKIEHFATKTIDKQHAEIERLQKKLNQQKKGE